MLEDGALAICSDMPIRCTTAYARLEPAAVRLDARALNEEGAPYPSSFPHTPQVKASKGIGRRSS